MYEQFKNSFPKFYEQLQSGKGEPVEQVLPGITDAELQKLEEALGLPLPDSYKSFLRCARGLWLRGGIIQFSSSHPFFHNFPGLEQLTPHQLQALKAKDNSWPPSSQGMLCFADFSLEADGDQVLFDVRKGLMNGEYPVMYYAHEDQPASVRKMANSFSEWMEEFLNYHD